MGFGRSPQAHPEHTRVHGAESLPAANAPDQGLRGVTAPSSQAPSESVCDSRGCSGHPHGFGQPLTASTPAQPPLARAKGCRESRERGTYGRAAQDGQEQLVPGVPATRTRRQPGPAPPAPCPARHGGHRTPDDAGRPLHRQVVHRGGVDPDQLVTRLQLPLGRAPCGQPAQRQSRPAPPTRGAQRRLDWKGP